MKSQPKAQKATRRGAPSHMQVVLDKAQELIRNGDVADNKAAFAKKVLLRLTKPKNPITLPKLKTVTNNEDFTLACRNAGITSRERSPK
jgi:hypothetical protein